MIGTKAILSMWNNFSFHHLLLWNNFSLFSLVTSLLLFYFLVLSNPNKKKEDLKSEENLGNEESEKEKEKENEKIEIKLLGLKTVVKNLSACFSNLEENCDSLHNRLVKQEEELKKLKEKIEEFERLCQDD